jgi:hypothetical protein
MENFSKIRGGLLQKLRTCSVGKVYKHDRKIYSSNERLIFLIWQLAFIKTKRTKNTRNLLDKKFWYLKSYIQGK